MSAYTQKFPGRRGLLELADFLEKKVPDEQFNMACWSEQQKEAFGKQAPERITPHCGTVGCALGWAPTVFPRLLRLDSDGVPTARRQKDQNAYLIYSSECPYALARRFFDLDSDGVEEFYLFDPYSYAGYAQRPIAKAQVVARLREVGSK